MRQYYQVLGIVLRRVNWGEADRLLTFYTREYGRLRLIAKGARRLQSRKSGSLELFNLVKLAVVRGRSLDFVTEVEVQESYSCWRRNLLKVAVAYYFCELVDRLTPEGQINPSIFLLLEAALRGLEKKEMKLWVRDFEEKLLDELGFGVPAKIRAKSGSLRSYIETITEKEIKSPTLLNGLFKKN